MTVKKFIEYSPTELVDCCNTNEKKLENSQSLHKILTKKSFRLTIFFPLQDTTKSNEKLRIQFFFVSHRFFFSLRLFFLISAMIEKFQKFSLLIRSTFCVFFIFILNSYKACTYIYVLKIGVFARGALICSAFLYMSR